jgi:hypothetical protein
MPKMEVFAGAAYALPLGEQIIGLIKNKMMKSA